MPGVGGEENALYWVDIPAGGLQRWSAGTGHVGVENPGNARLHRPSR
jgi:sugar lactone lactonase YvrE